MRQQEYEDPDSYRQQAEQEDRLASASWWTRNRSAIAVKALRDQPERFLATVQTGITVVGAAAAAYGGEVFAQGLSPLIARVPGLAPYASKIGECPTRPAEAGKAMRAVLE